MGSKFKQKIFITFATVSILLGTLAPTVDVIADASKSTIESGVDEYLGDDGDTALDLIDKFSDENYDEIRANRDSIKYVLYRIFTPMYINDVSKGVLANHYDGMDPRIDGYICDPSEPNNLLNHNCNIPNFSAELLQSAMVGANDHAIIGGERTSAKSSTGYGVPTVPGGKVPADPSKRKQAYTALELFGYDMNYTDYQGEWDKISKSSTARILSNIGTLDGIRAVGAGVWEGMKAGLGGFISGFSFNPFRWATSAIDAAAGGGLNSLVDTYELNLVAGNLWKRDYMNERLYGVYVLTDKEVIIESSMRYMRNYSKMLNKAADESPELQEVMELEHIPDFKYDPNRETEESIKKRKEIERGNKKIIKEAKKNDEEPKLKEVPEPVMMTEEEQLQEWGENNKAILDKARSKGLIGAPSTFKSYDKLVEDWNAKWEVYAEQTFDANYDVVKELISDIDKEYFIKDPFSDPKQPISHYVCADDNGKPMRAEDGSYEYVYTKYNEGSKEFVNPKCKAVRPPVTEAYYGSGWHVSRPLDTRHYTHFKASGVNHSVLLGGFGSWFSKITLKISSFVAKTINQIIDLSFSPILEKLGIADIVEVVMDGFRDTIFFPLSVMVAAFGAVMLLLRVLQNGSAKHFLVTMFSMLIVFIFGTAFLIRPSRTINLIEKVPHKIDNAIVDIVLAEPEGNSLCSAGGKGGARTAQCNVWGATVFHPWVYGQFGTSYGNLYANGHAPSGGSSMKNTNSNLVGNAKVDLGAGQTEHNWALYQLSLMKSGSITSEDKNKPLGVVDPNMYKIVDMQAGPQNGRGTDGRFIRDWSGASTSRFLASMLGMVQSFFIMSSIGVMGLLKIEYSFLFAIGLLVLPIALLRALTPGGIMRFPQYLARMLALFMKRILIVFMLTLSLKFVNVVYASGASFISSAMIVMIMGTVFKTYRKELLSLVDAPRGEGLMSGDPEVIRDSIKNSLPLNVQNNLERTKHKVKNAVGGFMGGALYGLDYGKQKNKEIEAYNEKVKQMHKEGSIDERSVDELLIRKRSRLSHMLDGAISGAEESASIGEKRADNLIRRTGFSGFEVYGKAKESVYRDGVVAMEKGDDPIQREIFRDATKYTNHGHRYMSLNEEFTEADRELLKDPEIQKAIREMASMYRKILKESGEDNFELYYDDMSTRELAKLIDKKRIEQLNRDLRRNPKSAYNRIKRQVEIDMEKDELRDIDSSTEAAHERREEHKHVSNKVDKRHANKVAREIQAAILKEAAQENLEKAKITIEELTEKESDSDDE